jgi:hypothetical protein
MLDDAPPPADPRQQLQLVVGGAVDVDLALGAWTGDAAAAASRKAAMSAGEMTVKGLHDVLLF